MAGAGPAGARLALNLAQQGHSVTLVDALATSNHNVFSSAAMPMAAAVDLRVPTSCWSVRWSGWQLLDPDGLEHQWWSASELGVVLDFAGLRDALWAQARDAGVELLLGTRVELTELDNNVAQVRLFSGNGQVLDRRVRWLVDATGARRALLRRAGIAIASEQDPLLSGTGAEWLIQVDDRSSARWRDRLSFFLGRKWVHHGYGWIFPMDQGRLKVGVCRLPPRHSQGRHRQGLGDALRNLLRQCGLQGATVLDRHGGMVSSTIRRDQAFGQGALIGIGDAAGTANLLGGEGIRHALVSADCLARTFQAGGDPSKLRSRYERDLRLRLGWRWPISGRLARRTWGLAPDQRADRRMRRLIEGLSSRANAEDLSSLLFDYRFERYGLRLLPYVLH